MKQVLLFLSDKSDEWIVNKFHSLLLSKNEETDVFFLYHRKNQTIPEKIEELNHYTFTNEILRELGYTPIRDTLIPGSNHFPLLKFYLENPQYDYYWLIEDDVFFSGNWKTLFEAYQNDSTDFIASHIKRYTENPDWCWWESLHTEHEEVRNENKVRSFNPIYRLSNKALKSIDATLKHGWHGHHEVLIPTFLYTHNFTIKDMGGNGSFVPQGKENQFYTIDSMSHLPVKVSLMPNCIHHSVKEKKLTDSDSFKRNCVISAVGRNSLHREWIKEKPDFDLHLIVYDDSFNQFYEDTDFVCAQKGYKLKLIYNYLQRNPEYIEKYKYFFFPDDDIRMDTENISGLFRIMEKYELQIAQPALSDSYYTYEHTMRDKFCILRYTNFVEMMLPCFSREALRKVLLSFNGTESGWGVDFHWPKLIDFSGREMAVIDSLHAIHTRPVQSGNWKNQNELNIYTQKHNLSQEIMETGVVLADLQQINKSAILKTDRETYNSIKESTISIADRFMHQTYLLDYPIGFSGLIGISFFLVNYYHISGKKKYLDRALDLVELASTRIILIKEDLNFITGLPGFSWYIEYLAQHGIIENNTDEILEVVCKQLDSYSLKELSIDELINLGFHYLGRITNRTRINTESYKKEKGNMIRVINAIKQYLSEPSEQKQNIHPENIIFCTILLYQTNKRLTLPEIGLVISMILKEIKETDSFDLVQFLKNDLISTTSKNKKGQKPHPKYNTKNINKNITQYIAFHNTANTSFDMNCINPLNKMFNIYILKILYSLFNTENSHSNFSLNDSYKKRSLKKDWKLFFLGFILERIKTPRFIHKNTF